MREEIEEEVKKGCVSGFCSMSGHQSEEMPATPSQMFWGRVIIGIALLGLVATIAFSTGIIKF